MAAKKMSCLDVTSRKKFALQLQEIIQPPIVWLWNPSHHSILHSKLFSPESPSDWAVSAEPRAWPFLPKPRLIFRVTLPLEHWPVGCQICIAIWDTPCPLTFLSTFLCRQMSDLHCSLIPCFSLLYLMAQ